MKWNKMTKWQFRGLSFPTRTIWGRMAEVSMGPKVPCTGKKQIYFSIAWSSHAAASLLNFFWLLTLNGEKRTQVERCCRKSLQRALYEVVAAGSLAPSIKRMISDRDPTDSILSEFSENGVPYGAASIIFWSMCFVSFCIDFNYPWNWSGIFHEGNGAGWQVRA